MGSMVFAASANVAQGVSSTGQGIALFIGSGAASVIVAGAVMTQIAIFKPVDRHITHGVPVRPIAFQCDARPVQFEVLERERYRV
jgi:hypothetical protein